MVKIESDPKLDFSSVLIKPKRSFLNSRSEVDLVKTLKFRNNYEWSGIPIIAANMASVGTFEVYNELSKNKIITAFHKFYKLQDYKDAETNLGVRLDPDYFMVSCGIRESDYENLCEIVDNMEVRFINLDVPNGYIPNFVSFCKKIRVKYPNVVLSAGNVATSEMVESLIMEADVDIIKVGIGPGSVCTTRKITGVGIPQLSCIMECADAAHGLGRYIIGDGGITCPGDLSKAYCGGADFVMMGGCFAGHLENPGEVIEKNGQKYKIFYGMSSNHAMSTHYKKKETYRAGEGKVVEIKYKGEINNTVSEYLGGLRSTCTYIGAENIKHMSKCTTFVLVSQQLNHVYS